MEADKINTTSQKLKYKRLFLAAQRKPGASMIEIGVRAGSFGTLMMGTRSSAELNTHPWDTGLLSTRALLPASSLQSLLSVLRVAILTHSSPVAG